MKAGPLFGMAVLFWLVPDLPGETIARYSFDEFSASGKFEDLSGNANPGRASGPDLIADGIGGCLQFDGEDDFVDCGNFPSLEHGDAASLEVWVSPEGVPQGEPGIAGNHFSGILLTYYSNGKVYWYIGDGGNNCQAVLSTGGWNHVVGTFDGEFLCLYIGGRLADRRPSKFRSIEGGGRFLIGCVAKDPSVQDPVQSKATFFSGKIDEVRVYDRALSATEVETNYLREAALIGTSRFRTVLEGPSIRSASCRVTVSPDGAVGLRTRSGDYTLESAWSYPGNRIGWNCFGARESGQEGWVPIARKASEDVLVVEARGPSFSVVRRLTLEADRLSIEDTVTNTSGEPQGFLIDHEVWPEQRFSNAIAPGGPECPALLANSEEEAIGLLVEDDVGRRKFEPQVGMPPLSAGFRTGQFALGAGGKRTFRWKVYLLPKETSFLDFANRIRDDWNSNFRMEGPIDWFDIGGRSDLLADPDRLKAYLHRKHQRIVLLMPWLDYDPGTFDHVWPREEYQQRMRDAAARIRAASPGIQVLGCIETDWVTIDPATIPGGEKLPFQGAGNIRLNTEQTAILDRSGIPFLDSVRRDRGGNLIVEAYRRGGQQQAALGVYPAEGNHQAAFLMDQVRFLLDEVGLDGFYIDEFSQAYRNDLRDYGGWDGWSADIDPKTGNIERTYIDCSLAGIEARVNLCRMALDRGKWVVANTYCTAEAEQSLPVFRFSETQASFNPYGTEPGTAPMLAAELFRGSLASPLGLGILSQPIHPNEAETLGRALLAYLRHGMLYCHYALGDLSPEMGEYGLVNAMFPITPIELHEGWIVGKERVLTCVSGDFPWRGPKKPQVHFFDLLGREQEVGPSEWNEVTGRVHIGAPDWTFFAAIEAAP